ncbi:hypothetical protein ACKKBF_B37270 [Auxenochlorella protothecoides x Auxenochlorella symbiontica]
MAELFITAFGGFQGVSRNPTEDLLEDVVGRCKDSKTNDLWKLVGHTVLPVAAKEVETWLKDTLYGKILSNNYSHPVVVHLGVDKEATEYRLETYAANEASFRCPDQAGWQPSQESIDNSHPFASKLLTDLPVSVIAGLLKAQGLPVEQSFDAGRFVCNWTYYHSLRLALETRPRVHVVFVHVPPLAVMPLEEQKEVMWHVLAEVAGAVVGGPEKGGVEDALGGVDARRLPSLLRALRR